MIEVHVGLAGRHFCKFCDRAFGSEHWGSGAGVNNLCPARRSDHHHETEVRRWVVLELVRATACATVWQMRPT